MVIKSRKELFMYGIEESYCDAIIQALLLANLDLMERPIKDALQRATFQGKDDTLVLDHIPESSIVERLKKFDQYAYIYTEERGKDANRQATSVPVEYQKPKVFFVSDPTDRSTELRKFLNSYSDHGAKVWDAITENEAIEKWEDSYSGPASVTGACSAITCLRWGLPICTGILNYLTQTLVLACSAGVFRINLELGYSRSYVDKFHFETISKQGDRLEFPAVNPVFEKQYTAFMGNDHYIRNLQDAELFELVEDLSLHLHYDRPSGPSRILYLSTLQPLDEGVGFIIANGEKVVEWVHWLSFVRFLQHAEDHNKAAFHLYELHPQRPWTRDGILMSTSPLYSVFQEIEKKQMVINTSQLMNMSNPSQFRSTLLVIPSDNDTVQTMVRRHRNRQIEFVHV